MWDWSLLEWLEPFALLSGSCQFGQPSLTLFFQTWYRIESRGGEFPGIFKQIKHFWGTFYENILMSFTKISVFFVTGCRTKFSNCRVLHNCWEWKEICIKIFKNHWNWLMNGHYQQFDQFLHMKFVMVLNTFSFLFLVNHHN